MLKILVLVCSTSVDYAACDTSSALDVVRAMRVSTPQQCGFLAQTLMAQTALAPEPGRQYMKTVCVHEPAQAVAAAKS